MAKRLHAVFVTSQSSGQARGTPDLNFVLHVFAAELSGENYTLDIDEIFVFRDDVQSTTDSFVGVMQNLYIDDQRYFDHLTSGGAVGPLPPGLSIDSGGGAKASLNETEQTLFTVTFRGRNADESYAAVQTLQIVGDTRASLMIRTSAGDGSEGSDGILLYNGGLVNYNVTQRPSRSTGERSALIGRVTSAIVCVHVAHTIDKK